MVIITALKNTRAPRIKEIGGVKKKSQFLATHVDEESSTVLRMNCQGSEEFMFRCRMRSRVNLDNSNLKMTFLMFLMYKT